MGIGDGLVIRLEEMVDTDSEETASVTLVLGSRLPRLDPNDPAPSAHADGPPFAIGDSVVVQLSADQDLLRGCIIESNHPWYCVHLEDGRITRVSSDVGYIMPAALHPAHSYIVEGSEELLRACNDVVRSTQLSSFGIQIDSQLHYLR